MTYNAILFDLGNTLAIYNGDQTKDLYQGHLNVVKHLSSFISIEDIESGGDKFHQFIKEKFEDRLHSLIETPLKKILFEFVFDNFWVELTTTQIDELVKTYFSTTEPNWVPAEQLFDVLDTIKNKGIKMGILSNACSDQNVQNMVDDLNIREYFDFVISSCNLELRKPKTDAFLEAIKNWDLDKSEILMVGDTMTQDILGATKIGIPSAWISYGRDESYLDYAPTIIIKQLSDLISYL